jgi:phosphonate transport system ATP-binding protein
MGAPLRLEGLGKHYGGRAPAVSEVTLAFEPGSFVGIIGRSGAGKSTLLRMINRLVEPTSGRILSGELDVTALHGAALHRWRARTAMVFQQFNLVGRLDVLHNVLMGRLHGAPWWRALPGWFADDDKALALAALEQFDIADLAAQRAEQLSGGQQQRVALARALAQEPALVLADEPIASLDPRNTRIVMDALRRLNQVFGITVLCNLHSVDLARSYCGRLVGMSAGRVVFDGAPAQLTDEVTRALYNLEGEVADDAAAGQPGAARAAASPAALSPVLGGGP